MWESNWGLGFILCGTLLDILRRLGTYCRVVPIVYDTTTPAEFLFLQNTFLLLEFLSAANNSTIKRLIVRGFHCHESARCLKIIAILAQEITPIVIHPISPTKAANQMDEFCRRAPLNHLRTLGCFSRGQRGGGGTNAWRRKMGAKFLVNGL